MNEIGEGTSRRALLRTGTAWALSSLFGCRGTGQAASEPAAYASLRPERSRVVLVRHADVVGGHGTIAADILRAMLNEAVVALLGVASAGDAWKRIVRPEDVVGVKSNAWAELPTPRALEAAIRATRWWRPGCPPRTWRSTIAACWTTRSSRAPPH